MFNLHVFLTFQGIELHPSMDFTVALESTEKRRNWRRTFETQISLLNQELNLGWMTCISPEYESSEGLDDSSSMTWTPVEAIDQVRQMYQARLSQTARQY